jgi:hypothetical protein
MAKRFELAIPPAAAADPKARELLRMWAANGAQHVTIAADAWKEPAVWGIALVDLARHLARAYEQLGHGDAVEVLGRIRAGFDVEWSRPTDEGRGQLLGEDEP